MKYRNLAEEALDGCLASIERTALTFYRLGFRTPARPLIDFDEILVWPLYLDDAPRYWFDVALKEPGYPRPIRYHVKNERDRIRSGLLACLRWDPVEVIRFLKAAGKAMGECKLRLYRPRELLERDPAVREALEARFVIVALDNRPGPAGPAYPELIYRVLEHALKEAWKAVDDLLDGFPGSEQAWIDLAPRIEVAPELFWPAVSQEYPEARPTLAGVVTASGLICGWNGPEFDGVLSRLITATYDDPRLVLKAVEGLEAIAAWCRDRLEYPDRVLAERPDIRELLEYWAKEGGEK